MTKEIVEKYIRTFGKKNYEKILDAKKKYSNNQFIRFNLNKTNSKEVSNFLKKNRVKFSKTFLSNAFKIDKSFFNISSSLFSLTGKIYLQDLASQVPINCIDISKFENKKIKVLDMAASPGSKTTQLYDFLKFHKINFEITALEPDKTRLLRLINNLQKQECENIKIFNIQGEKFETKEKFNLIILDAPCSGNIIGDKNWLKKRTQKGILGCSYIQRDLLIKAQKLLKKDGQLIYSTCSLEIEENENNVKWILSQSNLKNINCIELPFNTKCLNNVKGLRFMPYDSGTQGFFVSRFIKL